MRIVVCIKHVPDVQSERRIEDGRLVRGEEDVLNELDENAVEAAVCLAEEADGYVVGKVNVDEEPALAAQFGVRTIPTVILFQNGKAVKQSVGVQPKAFFQQMLSAQ